METGKSSSSASFSMSLSDLRGGLGSNGGEGGAGRRLVVDELLPGAYCVEELDAPC